MPEQIYIGNFTKGLQTNVEPFNLDNNVFPFLFNFCAWRKRILKKRGTSYLGQLTRQVFISATPNQWQYQSFNLIAGTGVGNGNLLTNLIAIPPGLPALESTGSITPGSISINDGVQTYTDPSANGTLQGSSGGTGTINYATGAFSITGDTTNTITGSFAYYPGLPVMGLEDLANSGSIIQNPILLAFDTKYSYEVNDTSGIANFYGTNYYKTSLIPFVWNGQDYQQFWTTNYQGALWATNGNPGFHFVSGTYTSGSPGTTIKFNFKNGVNNFTSLVVGDTLWFNEWPSVVSPAVAPNGLVGTVSNISDAASGNYVVTFTTAVTVSGTGIAQLLTNSIPGQDGIRWYDGSPTDTSGNPGTLFGWVNFAPPLTGSASVSINDQIPKLYYLTGANAILPYKDRLLFFAPWITALDGTQIQLIDVVLWSWNGTPYYASSPLPVDETSNIKAYYVDQTGLGGYLSAGISQPIKMVNINEDLLIIGFGGNGKKTRFAYTGNDIQPFLFYSINSEFPSFATFSSINLDTGVLDLGQFGLTKTDQQSTTRIDIDIPDFVFDIQQTNHGPDRICAVRNFQKEWVYFCYPIVQTNLTYNYPTQSFFYNYRENTWAIMYENFTTFGSYRPSTGLSWATLPYNSWDEWTDPWDYGDEGGLYRDIIGGTPQGFVLKKDQGTNEGQCCAIAAISNNGGLTQITSYNHCLLGQNPNTGTGDFIYIQNAIGQTYLNGQIAQVAIVVDVNNFTINIPFQSGTYLGLGTFAKLCQPYLQTKMFNPYWEQGRKVRLCAQKYLFDRTQDAQVTIDIYLSQDANTVWNIPTPGFPNPNIYSTTLFTCPESTNLGLTAPNVNLQMPLALGGNQIWHRDNTSLIGDSVQIGITLSTTQMMSFDYATSEITLHGIQLTLDRSQLLA